tara:strand:+ start:258 stop:677 length:420 start_codon:yes stop_codon:yes gene_type:complete
MLGLLGLGAGIVPSMMAFDALQGQIPGIMPSILGNSLFGQVNKLINPPNKENPNTILNAMTPEVAGVFQGMGVNPQGFAKQAVAENDEDDNSLLTQIALQGLLNQPDPQPMAPANIQGAFMRGQQMPMQSMSRFYGGLL